MARSFVATTVEFVAGTALAVSLLAGCSTSVPWHETDAPAVTATDPSTAPTDEPADELGVALVPDGTARENVPWFLRSVQQRLDEDPDADGRSIAIGLADAGFDRSKMSWTASTTPTGTAADSVIVAVKWSGECLIAQKRGNRLAVEVGAQADGVCLLGEVERF